MSNMSYCRFENTNNDLRDCKDALEELLNDMSVEELDGRELAAAKQLVEQCFDIVQMAKDALNRSADAMLDGNTTLIADQFVTYVNRRV